VHILLLQFNCCGFKNASEWTLPYHESCINHTTNNGTDPWNVSKQSRDKLQNDSVRLLMQCASNITQQEMAI